MRTNWALIAMAGLAAGAVLTGCVNPYSVFYRGKTDARTLPGYQPVDEPVQAFRTHDLKGSVLEWQRKGYGVVGSSGFEASDQDDDVGPDQAKAHAAKIGAHVVLMWRKYSHTDTATVPIHVPVTSTSTTNADVTSTDGDGYYGHATTTKHGTSVVMQSVSDDRINFTAVFLAKKVPPRVGIIDRKLDVATRQRLGRNTGISVLEVIDDSPAFLAGVLPGDVLLSIDGEPIQSTDHYHRVIDALGGKVALFAFDRSGQPIEKQIQIGVKKKSEATQSQ